MTNPTTTDREGRIKQKLDEKLQILNSPMNHIHTEHLLDVVNEIVAAELKEEHQRTLQECIKLVNKHDPSSPQKRDTNKLYWGNTLRAALSELEGEITSKEQDDK